MYGARPLKRAMQREILNPLAVKLIEGAFKKGQTVELDASKDGGLVFKEGAARPACEPDEKADA